MACNDCSYTKKSIEDDRIKSLLLFAYLPSNNIERIVHMRYLKRIFIMLLIVALLICSMGTVAFASELSTGEIVEISPVSEINDLNIRLITSEYMSDRKQLLIDGTTSSFSSATPGIIADETSHKDMLVENSLTVLNISFTISSIHCESLMAYVTLNESVTYALDSETLVEIVEHNLTIYKNKANTLLVISDQYREVFSGFESCSYVSPEDQTVAELNSVGSRYCIANVASGEIGVTETGTNVTKYGAWYGLQDEWCVMFVCWCANQANISQSYITLTASADTMRNFFDAKGQFYKSPTQGGTVTPRVGDLYFTGSAYNDVGHIGIVTSVGSDYMYVVEGNTGDKVAYTYVPFSQTSYVGFARPEYPSSSHTYTSWTYGPSGHKGVCDNCGYTSSTTEAHSFSYSNGVYVCYCGYRTSSNIGINSLKTGISEMK